MRVDHTRVFLAILVVSLLRGETSAVTVCVATKRQHGDMEICLLYDKYGMVDMYGSRASDIQTHSMGRGSTQQPRTVSVAHAACARVMRYVNSQPTAPFCIHLQADLHRIHALSGQCMAACDGILLVDPLRSVRESPVSVFPILSYDVGSYPAMPVAVEFSQPYLSSIAGRLCGANQRLEHNIDRTDRDSPMYFPTTSASDLASAAHGRSPSLHVVPAGPVPDHAPNQSRHDRAERLRGLFTVADLPDRTVLSLDDLVALHARAGNHCAAGALVRRRAPR